MESTACRRAKTSNKAAVARFEAEVALCIAAEPLLEASLEDLRLQAPALYGLLVHGVRAALAARACSGPITSSRRCRQSACYG